MKAFLITRDGFRKQMNLDVDKLPVIETVNYPELLPWGRPLPNPEDTIVAEKHIFYVERFFYDENDEQVAIYKER